MRFTLPSIVLCLAWPVVLFGCGDDDEGPRDRDAGADAGDRADGAVPRDGDVSSDGGAGDGLPTEATQIRADLFGPTDIAVGDDGDSVFFTAFDEAGRAGVFTMTGEGEPTQITSETSALVFPTSIALDCAGDTLFVADPAASEGGSLLTVPTGGGDATSLDVSGMMLITALAFDADCSTLFLAGTTPQDDAGTTTQDDEGVVASVNPEGGMLTVLASGAPLTSPIDIAVGADGTVFVLDGRAEGGALFRVGTDGGVEQVTTGLPLGTPGGLALTMDGTRALVTFNDALSNTGEIRIVDLSSGEILRTVEVPEAVDPAGLARARDENRFVFVDPEGGAIFRAE